MNKILTHDELLAQPFVQQGLAKYAEYLKQRIINKQNSSQQKAKIESSQPRKPVL